MSWKPGLMPILDVVLRVPPLFVMDSVLNGTFLLSWMGSFSETDLPITDEEIEDDLSPVIAVVFISFICFLGALTVFLLTTKHILEFYSFIFSGVVLWFSYWFNKNYILSELQIYGSNEDPISIIKANPGPMAVNIFVQLSMAFCYNSFRIESQARSEWSNTDSLISVFRTLTYVCLLQPVTWRLLVLSPTWLQMLPSLCVLLIGMELLFISLLQIRHLYSRARSAYTTIKVLIRTYGFQFFAESQWVRLHVPNVLRVFWITRTMYQIINLSVGTVYDNLEANQTAVLVGSDVMVISKQVLISGSETVIALLGMTSMISYVTHYIGIAMATFVGSENEDDKTMGTVSAILFFILAQQTGLTGLHPDKRLERLFRNFCLLSTAILHFIHGMINPLLMNLSAGHNANPWRHARPLFICFLLITLPVLLMVYLWERHSLSTWLLAVTAFSIEVIIKVLITLMLYGLFMYDTFRDPFWEKLDDYVYYIKATGNTIEFLFGIVLFCNGAWIMIFEHGGTIRACMMCIHAYFNIWVQAKQGWKVFINRRTAVKKIESLPIATQEQLESHNDVCAICYQELSAARVTRCNHLFHGVCLRKWLYMQDRCPLCHQLIYQEASEENQDGRQGPDNNNQDEGNLNNPGDNFNDVQGGNLYNPANQGGNLNNLQNERGNNPALHQRGNNPDNHQRGNNPTIHQRGNNPAYNGNAPNANEYQVNPLEVPHARQDRDIANRGVRLRQAHLPANGEAHTYQLFDQHGAHGGVNTNPTLPNENINLGLKPSETDFDCPRTRTVTNHRRTERPHSNSQSTVRNLRGRAHDQSHDSNSDPVPDPSTGDTSGACNMPNGRQAHRHQD